MGPDEFAPDGEPPRGPCHVQDRAARLVDAGLSHDDDQATEPAARSLKEHLDLVPLRPIEAGADGAGAFGFDRRDER
ncbi:hypothetical protein [Streptomyces ortus]|uniref:Uncharacterized protein n=1 Tax=Streptomyces ortus TaxID=2867268 RepID=A0ABT3V4K1_9ACTN|nr:hypothetical protein [Streptomyces ortus]MCX4234685.1 hypothetical protein [Streptomyces ortus]